MSTIRFRIVSESSIGLISEQHEMIRYLQVELLPRPAADMYLAEFVMYIGYGARCCLLVFYLITSIRR